MRPVRVPMRPLRVATRVVGTAALLVCTALVVPAVAQDVSSAPDAARPAAAPAYTLGPQDKLALRVFEWQTVKGEAREWPALTGSFSVGAAGTLSLPFVGEIVAIGRTPAALADEIGTRLQDRLGLPDRPEASVEVEEYRPLFVVGNVRAPGRFPFAPGLTVLQAFSLAGGVPDRVDYGGRVTRDLVNASGNIDILLTERAALIVRQARIAAEIAGTEADAAALVAAATGEGALEGVRPDQVERLARDEAAIMVSRRERRDREVAALGDLVALLQSEIGSLEEKTASLERQIALAEEDRQGVQALKSKGLAVNAQVLGIERTVADMRSRMLDMQASALRAEQEIAKAKQTQVGLQTAYEATVAEDRLETEAELAKVRSRIGLQEGLRDEALSHAAAQATDEAEVSVSFVLTRAVAGRSVAYPVSPDTAMAPGDVLEVRLSVGSRAPGGLSGLGSGTPAAETGAGAQTGTGTETEVGDAADAADAADAGAPGAPALASR